MESEIRKLSKKRDGNDSDDDDEHAKKKAKKSYLEEELAKYSKGRGLHVKKDGKKRDERDVLAKLTSFRTKLQKSTVDDDQDVDGGEEEEKEKATDIGMTGEEPGIEVDDDRGFMGHALRFPKDDGEEGRKAERDYEVIDPRQRGAKAKEEERERKQQKRANRGKRGGRHRR